MPSSFLVDPGGIDWSRTEMDSAEIQKINPHRGTFLQIDSVVAFDREKKFSIARRKIRDDEFWIQDHVPGRPIFPGVLLIEGAAQLCSLHYLVTHGLGGFLGLGGVSDVKFRSLIQPGEEFFYVALEKNLRSRSFTFSVQAIKIEETPKLLFEGTITGLRV
ncbi:MAG: beta-hydroxyacyl-ACP dehydratase [Planctomycetes bacterium]|nr:beta-hydroxyacyl-ACP dehydratase [Planctomycetota bacterium]